MPGSIQTAGVHHLRFTVTDVDRSRAFYTRLLGFELVAEMPNGVLLGNQTIMLGLGPAPSGAGPNDDRFDENRVGLDHLSLAVADRAALEEAARLLDEEGIDNDGVVDLDGFGIHVLPFRDPDNIAVELTAPAG